MKPFRLGVYDGEGRVVVIIDAKLTPKGRVPKYARETIENFIHYGKPGRIEITNTRETGSGPQA